MKKSLCRSTRLRPLSILLFSALSVQAANANEADDLTLAPVQVTGEQIVPDFNGVDATQIERSQANDLEDLFKRSPEVTIGGGVDIAQKLYIRGVEDPLLNISIDGATQATRIYHHNGRVSIEPELLKRVEVDAGTGNALSGPGALGGAVRFVTKDPADMLKPGQTFGGMLKGSYASNSDSFKTNTSLYGRAGDIFSGMISFTENQTDPYEDGNGDEQPGTGFDQDFLFTKLVADLTESQTLRLSYERRRDEGERTARPQWIVSGFNALFPMDIERETYTLNYHLQPVNNPYVDLTLTLFNTQTTLFQNGRFGPYFGDGESEGFDLRNISEFGRLQMTYGMDYREDVTTAGPGTSPGANEEESTVKGVYLQNAFALTDTVLLSAGLRYDDYELDDNDGLQFSEKDVSYNAGINIQLTPTLEAYAAYTEAFKGPLAQDAFKLDGWSKDPNLKPEEASNREAGLRWEKDVWFASAKLYQTEIKNLFGDPVGGPRLYQNVGDLESDGYVLEAGYISPKWYASLSYHENDAEVDGVDANAYDHGGIANSIGDTWIAQVDYQLNSAWSFGWTGRFLEGVDSLQTNVGEIEKPGYGIHDLYVQWFPAVKTDLRVTLTVRNLLDKFYLDHASNADFQHIPGFQGIAGLPEPGRDIRLSVAWQF